LPLYDTDLGPSDPLPPEPANLGSADDTEMISAPGRLPQVTALAIAEEGTDSVFVISGHKDGTLRKWDINTSKCLWAVYHYNVPDWQQNIEGYHIEGYPSTGIRGIAIREDPLRGHGTYLRH
jgi:WD40 repeat protein